MRRGFTMVELLTAGILLALVLSAMGLSLAQVNKSRIMSRSRADAYLRADAAMRIVRRELISILRQEDLYYTRLLIIDNGARLDDWEVERDEILLFNSRVQATRSLDYNGDGSEFESAFRIEQDDDGPVLWHRRDAMPDNFPRGGGIASPVIEGLAALSLEAWDGEQWNSVWDSDHDGLPQAIRITVEATGAQVGQSLLDAPVAVLRTVVSVDRSRMPLDMADKLLAEAVMEKWGLEDEAFDGIVEAIASNTPLPLPSAGGAGLGSGAGLGTGSSGTSIQLPAGFQLPDGVVLPDGVTLPGGGRGGSSGGSTGGGSSGGGGGGR